MSTAANAGTGGNSVRSMSIDVEKAHGTADHHHSPNATNNDGYASSYGHNSKNFASDGPVNRGPRILPAFGGELQPGTYTPSFRKFGNPAPLGLCAFSLTTFVLSLINAGTRGVNVPNVVVGLAYGYGGLVQLLSGMWEMAVGNTFGATALASYGGFWLSWAIIETSGGFGIVEAYKGDVIALNNALGFYLLGWFIFTTIILFCTLRSTVAFFSLFFFLDITFLLLAIAHLHHKNGQVDIGVQKAAGVIGLVTSFIGWWNALAGLVDESNSFFMIPVLHFPWSEKAMSDRKRARRD